MNSDTNLLAIPRGKFLIRDYVVGFQSLEDGCWIGDYCLLVWCMHVLWGGAWLGLERVSLVWSTYTRLLARLQLGSVLLR